MNGKHNHRNDRVPEQALVARLVERSDAMCPVLRGIAAGTRFSQARREIPPM